ncbi:MAG: hypothetical protein U0R64_05550 [Candidatus Nanopelagicales bacterium]
MPVEDEHGGHASPGVWRHPEARAEAWTPEVAGAYLASFRRLRDLSRPRATTPLRLAFLGQRSYFGVTAPPEDLPGLTSHFFDRIPGTDPSEVTGRLRRWAPDVLVVFRPELHHDVLRNVPETLRVGLLTEPVLIPGWEGNLDLQRRTSEFAALDPSSCDLYVGFNPTFTDTWESRVPIWRHLPLPVHDSVYCPPDAVTVPRRAGGIFVGRVTDHRNRFLMPLKHRFDWTVVDHGLRSLAGITVGLNLHADDYPNFENRVALHLARGHLVLTEPLSPQYDLIDGVQVLSVDRPRDLVEMVADIDDLPERHHHIAQRGRLAAESFRASRRWPDLLVDLAAAVNP